jgi:hypothetical protein
MRSGLRRRSARAIAGARCANISAAEPARSALFSVKKTSPSRVRGATTFVGPTAAHRRFCSQCGTPVFSEAEERPTVTFIRAGTLDNPDLAPPTAIIWPQSAPNWACFDPDLPRIEGQPPPLKVCPRRLLVRLERGHSDCDCRNRKSVLYICPDRSDPLSAGDLRRGEMYIFSKAFQHNLGREPRGRRIFFI